MLEFVICDDEAKILNGVVKIIKEAMQKHNYLYNIITFEDYDAKFENYLNNNRKSVIYILDIEMPSESGISVARRIRNTDKNSIVIILTSHHETADEIYKGRLNILTFISKRDRCEENLMLSIDEAIEYLKDGNDLLLFQELGNDYAIPYKDILYIKKDGRKTLIKTVLSDYEVYISLDKLKSLLPANFKQSHRACIINMNRVSKISYTKRMIYFDNNTSIDYIGDKYKGELTR